MYSIAFTELTHRWAIGRRKWLGFGDCEVDNRDASRRSYQSRARSAEDQLPAGLLGSTAKLSSVIAANLSLGAAEANRRGIAPRQKERLKACNPLWRVVSLTSGALLLQKNLDFREKRELFGDLQVLNRGQVGDKGIRMISGKDQNEVPGYVLARGR